jgi:DNA-directed RNA polymerase II subunit RPB1
MPLYSHIEYDSVQDIDIENVKGIQFSVLSPEEILKRSVCEINRTDILSGNEPAVNGLFDIRMGVLEFNRLCGTCGQKASCCPNHMGHIKLEVPVYHARFFDITKKILKTCCFNCSKLIISKNTIFESFKNELFRIKNIKSNKKKFDAYLKLVTTCKVKNCGDDGVIGCGQKLHTNVVKDGSNYMKILLEWNNGVGVEKDILEIFPEDVLKVFKRITDEDMEMFGFNPLFNKPEWLLTTILPVPPPAVRPSIIEESGQRREDDLTHKLCDIIKCNNMIKDKKKKNTSQDNLNKIAIALQYHVFTFLDNQLPGICPSLQRNGRKLKSVSDRMTKKDGRIRGNLNAKRVDQSARSVITPDPFISIDQLGVPLKIAINLTFPEVVNKYNIDKMKELIKNGPDNWPGAKYIRKIGDNGSTLNIKYGNRSEISNQIKYGDVVHRHLMNDDYILFNRQPSLHKMSMMCHKVTIMPHKTFRLNVLDTPPYNADFDGDEMNMHFPQSIQTMGELKDLASIPLMIISPKSGKPIIEVVQDILVGSYRITDDSVYLDKKEVSNLQMVNSYFTGKLDKKEDKYTGKEIFSMILPPSLFIKNRELNINDSIIKKGKLDKKSFQSMSNGLIPVIYHDYGPFEAKRFLDNTQRLICRWFMLDGFSVGISDLVMNEETNSNIKQTIKDMKIEAYQKLDSYRRGEIKNNSISNNESFVESSIINILNKINKDVSTICLSQIKDDTNRMINMVRSGSKGKENNVAQMIGCVGQQNFDGKRISYGFTERTLPHFTKYDDGPDARGFVENSFINGLTPQEVFFHAMGGREGLIDTAVKTSDTGYIQRRLVKSMEDAKIYNDYTVRNAPGTIIQYTYGEDGMDGTKIEEQPIYYIDKSIIEMSIDYLISDKDKLSVYLLKDAHTKTITKDAYEKCKEHFKQIVKDKEFLITKIFNYEQRDKILYPIPFCRIIENSYNRVKSTGIKRRKTNLDSLYILDKIDELIEDYNINYKHQSMKYFHILLRMHLNPKVMIIKYGFTKEIFDNIIISIQKYFKQSVAHPGEMIGIIAAQTIGEMGTQMTLDSFHVSGTDAAVKATSGVPRLKELLSVSKNIKTPTMIIFLKDDIGTINLDSPEDELLVKSNAIKVKNTLEIVRLCDILKTSSIYWDDHDFTNIVEDKGFLNIYKAFSEINKEDNGNESKLVLRMVFDKEKMLFHDLKMIDIYTSLNLVYNEFINTVYSDDNADQCIMRFRMNYNTLSKSLSDGDDIASLKALEHNLVYNILLKGVKHIKRISLNKTKKNIYNPLTLEFHPLTKWVLNTNGSNMKEILSNPNVDSYKTRSNDIREINDILGIEAARKALALELEEVIGEGIMNYRHMSVLIDTMTCKGQLMSIDRHGINRSDIGPLAKSSFEETTDMLVNAAIFSEYDHINGVSANVMLGQKVPCGTGDVDILLDEEMFSHFMKDIIVEKNNDILDNIEEEEENILDNHISFTAELKDNTDVNTKCFTREVL